MPNPGPTRVPELTTANPVPRATEMRIGDRVSGRERSQDSRGHLVTLRRESRNGGLLIRLPRGTSGTIIE